MTIQEAEKESTRLFSIGNPETNIEKISKYIVEKTGKSMFRFTVDLRKEFGENTDYHKNLMIIEALTAKELT